MRNLLKIFVILAISLIFLGCLGQNLPQSKSVLFLIKSKNLKLNDTAFIHKARNSSKIQVYSNGQNIFELKFNEKACVNGVCFSKLEFNEKFLGRLHYNSIFEDILDKKPIYGGKNLVKNACGFTQNISENSIKYEICDNKTVFIDKKTNTKIIIKELYH